MPIRRALDHPTLTETKLDRPMTTVMRIKVKPGSRRSVLEELSDGTWVAHVKSAPIEGKANDELIALVAGHFGCRKSAVTIRSGSSARTKLVRVDND